VLQSKKPPIAMSFVAVTVDVKELDRPVLRRADQLPGGPFALSARTDIVAKLRNDATGLKLQDANVHLEISQDNTPSKIGCLRAFAVQQHRAKASIAP
jgi:hypothetical protein